MQQNTIKHTHRRVGRDSLRIAFQLPSPYPGMPFKVWRIRTVHQDHLFLLEGLVLESPDNVSRAVVAHVRAGDIVMITHHPHNGITPPHRGYLINEALEPVPLADLAPYAKNPTITNGPLMDYDGTGFVHFREKDLREFMGGKHPEWLQQHVDATLRIWRTEAPDLFANIAPTRWLIRKPWLLAMHDPQRALIEFPHLTRGSLGTYCIRRMMTPASQVLARVLPSKLKPTRRFANTEFLLEHHAHELSDDQLRTCARTSPSTALRIVPGTVDPRRRAILLSCAFPTAWHERALLQNPDFRAAVLDSLAEHYEEWMIANPDGLAAVLGIIANRLQLPPTAAETVRMLDRFGPEGRQALSDYIAEQV
jgi:hypothetical protein